MNNLNSLFQTPFFSSDVERYVILIGVVHKQCSCNCRLLNPSKVPHNSCRNESHPILLQNNTMRISTASSLYMSLRRRGSLTISSSNNSSSCSFYSRIGFSFFLIYLSTEGGFKGLFQRSTQTNRFNTLYTHKYKETGEVSIRLPGDVSCGADAGVSATRQVESRAKSPAIDTGHTPRHLSLRPFWKRTTVS